MLISRSLDMSLTNSKADDEQLRRPWWSQSRYDEARIELNTDGHVLIVVSAFLPWFYAQRKDIS